jgi:hypothetical protein
MMWSPMPAHYAEAAADPALRHAALPEEAPGTGSFFPALRPAASAAVPRPAGSPGPAGAAPGLPPLRPAGRPPAPPAAGAVAAAAESAALADPAAGGAAALRAVAE